MTTLNTQDLRDRLVQVIDFLDARKDPDAACCVHAVQQASDALQEQVAGLRPVHPGQVVLWLRHEPEGHATLLMQPLGGEPEAVGLVRAQLLELPDRFGSRSIGLTGLVRWAASTIGRALGAGLPKGETPR